MSQQANDLNRRVLVIDDNRSIHDDFRKILAPAAEGAELANLSSDLFGEPAPDAPDAPRFEIESALQGQEGHAKVAAAVEQGRPFAMAFVDVRMPPGWDGIETIEYLWKIDPHLEVVICTAFSDHSWEQIRKRLGSTDQLLILRKPFDAIEVRQFAAALTTKRRLGQSARDKEEELKKQVEERTRELARETEDHKRSRELMEQARDAAEAANRAKSGFLSTMSHEIRTPLNGVIGSLELMLASPLNEKQRQYLNIARFSAEALLSLINDILDFSKIEAGKLELESEPFNLHKQIRQLIPTLEPLATKKGLTLTCHIQPAVPDRVRGDWTRLRQILLNLVSNAIKFTQQGGVVVACGLDSVRDGKAMLRFTVTDTGIGIPANRSDRLFKVFSQVDASTTRKFGGSGLGLAICKRLSEAMGGQIGVSSEPDRGSTFWFTAGIDLGQDGDAPPPLILPDARRIRALALGLDGPTRRTLPAALAPSGIELVNEMEIAAAIKTLGDAARSGDPFAVVLVDADQQGAQAEQLLAAACNRDDLPKTIVAIIGVTGNASASEELRSRGYSGALAKSASPEEFHAAIVEAVTCAWLPERASKPAPQPETQSVASAFPGARVLVAEDNEVNQLVVSEILTQAGLVCQVAPDGRRAAQMALSGGFDVVLMDCQMPEMDGFEATRQIRREEGARKAARPLPIIALTANALAGDETLCLHAGMDAYLTKPLDPRKMIAAIDEMLRRSRHAAAPAAPEPPPAPAPQAAPQPSPSLPPIDVQDVLNRCMNNVDLLATIISKFEEQANSNLVKLDQAVAAGDAAATGRIGHTLKGAASLLSAAAVTDLAARLEQLGKSGRLELATELLEILKLEVQAVINFAPTAIAQARQVKAADKPLSGSNR